MKRTPPCYNTADDPATRGQGNGLRVQFSPDTEEREGRQKKQKGAPLQKNERVVLTCAGGLCSLSTHKAIGD